MKNNSFGDRKRHEKWLNRGQRPLPKASWNDTDQKKAKEYKKEVWDREKNMKVVKANLYTDKLINEIVKFMAQLKKLNREMNLHCDLSVEFFDIILKSEKWKNFIGTSIDINGFKIRYYSACTISVSKELNGVCFEINEIEVTRLVEWPPF